jgi:hypothetical protein
MALIVCFQQLQLLAAAEALLVLVTEPLAAQVAADHVAALAAQEQPVKVLQEQHLAHFPVVVVVVQVL